MLATAPEALPRDLEPLASIWIPGDPGPAMRHRWSKIGVKSRSGQRVKLRIWKIGGRVLTTAAAVAAFVAAVSDDGESAPPPESDADIARRGREAGAALEALGC